MNLSIAILLILILALIAVVGGRVGALWARKSTRQRLDSGLWGALALLVAAPVLFVAAGPTASVYPVMLGVALVVGIVVARRRYH